MSGDNQNEQSVMIPLDELLAQDPSLAGIQQTNPSAQGSSVDQKRLERVGLGAQNAAAPINSVVVPARRAEIKTKKLSSKLLSVVTIVLGVVALVAVGVYIGTLSNQGAQLSVVKPQPQQGAQMAKAPKTPAPKAVAAVTAAQTEEEPSEPEKAVSAQSSQRSNAKDSRTTARRKTRRAKRAPKAKAATPPPPPPPPPAAPAKPKASEASNLLKNIGKTSRTPAKTGSTDSASSGLPPRLSRSQILATLRKNQPSVSKCKSHVSKPTRLKVRVTVAGSGSVSKVSLVEPADLKGSPVEKCVLQRVKLFKFPKFGSPSMSFKLPFRLG